MFRGAISLGLLAVLAVVAPRPAPAQVPDLGKGGSTITSPSAPTGAEPPAGRPARTDRYGDPLPEGAVSRLGTVRFRHVRLSLVAYAPDGKALLSAGDGTFRRWDAATGKELQRWPIISGDVDCAALSADNKILAVARSEHVAGKQQIYLYDVATRKELHRLDPGENGMVHSLAFSPDGELLAAKPPHDALVTLWEVRTGKKRRELKPPGYDDLEFGSGGIFQERNLAFSPDGNYLACGSEDGVVRLWQVATGREVRQHPAASHTPLSVAFSPDGKVLAWSGPRHIHLAEVATGKELPLLPAGEDTPSRLAFSPAGRVLASVHSLGEVFLWDVARGKLLCRLEGDLFAAQEIAFSPDGKTLAVGLRGRIGRWDVATGKELPPPGGSQGPVYDLALSPDGRTAAVAYFGPTLGLWDTATGRQRQGLAADDFVSFAFAPDGKTLACASDKDVLRFIDVASAKQVRRFPTPPVWRGGLAYSADGATLALGNGEGGAVVEAATGKMLHEFRTWLPGETPSLLAFAADGSVLVLGDGPRVLPWDMATGRQSPPCRVTDEEIKAAALSPDGKTLALWGFRPEMKGRRRIGPLKNSGILALHEVSTGLERCRLRGADDLARDTTSAALAFSPDGKLLAVLADDCLRFWDVAAGNEIGQLQTRQDVCIAVAFAADGRTLATGGLDGTVLLWDLGTLRKPARQDRPDALPPRDLEVLWSDLAGEGAARAYRAVGTLAATPAAVPLLVDRLRREARAESERRQRIPRLLADLDSDSFPVRRSAAAELSGLADLPEPLLRQTLAHQPSAEVRRQVERLLENRDGVPPSAETLRVLRAVEVLERLATPEARQALQVLAEGAPEARLTREAKAALARLSKRPPAGPG
jgi:WD40 repeat protein